MLCILYIAVLPAECQLEPKAVKLREMVAEVCIFTMNALNQTAYLGVFVGKDMLQAMKD